MTRRALAPLAIPVLAFAALIALGLAVPALAQVLDLALPFFGLILLGYCLGRIFDAPEQGLQWMHIYVVYVALPALFFNLIAVTPLDGAYGGLPVPDEDFDGVPDHSDLCLTFPGTGADGCTVVPPTTVRALVDEAISEAGAAEPGDMGKVMGSLMPKVGSRADGKRVSAMVREVLAGGN